MSYNDSLIPDFIQKQVEITALEKKIYEALGHAYSRFKSKDRYSMHGQFDLSLNKMAFKLARMEGDDWDGKVEQVINQLWDIDDKNKDAFQKFKLLVVEEINTTLGQQKNKLPNR